MKTFTDSTGRSWMLTLNLGTAMLVKDRLGIDLLQPESSREPTLDDPEGQPVLTLLGTDEMLLGQVLCCMLEDQFTKHEVTEVDVRASFDGQTLLAAQKAFYEELVDFFQSRGRNDRAKAVSKQMEMISAAIQAAEAKIDMITTSPLEGDGQTFSGSQEASDLPTSDG
ncbi:hypothetical protein KS4_10910 [Poriferisphaera corsica]|uniref:Uncharacterized protein n=1 Tax=Poriferisphaera corsica TaxID=2528020 RepID=A0A517YS49_9BACT|nr:hypothetical protein [Poriferisphaera corsica]QDU33050.1 hypothetical protein KS4_10910 [Poriferisphaera corsica]